MTHQFSAEEIQIVLSRFWIWRFPTRLEQIYKKHAFDRSIKIFRFNGLFALGVFIIICLGIYRLIPPHSIEHTLTAYSYAIVVLLSVRLLSFSRPFNLYFNWYVTISSTVMLTIAIYVNNSVQLGEGSTLSYIGLTYIQFFIYCFVGLRLQLALLANLIGGFSGVLLTYAMGAEMDWKIMPLTFGTTNFLAMFLAYGLGRQERINFLQSYLLKLSLEKSERISREDALTGLANRRYLNEMMVTEWNRMLRQKTPLTIIMIDIDFFKGYNDTLGHLAGDQCLHQVATLISEEAKRGGELAARYGGEEFVLLFPDMNADLAKQQVERLIARVYAAAIPHPDSTLKIVTVSAGVSVVIPQPEMSVDVQLRQADNALYRAKANGKNRYEFFE